MDVKEVLAGQWQPIETAPKDGTPILLDTQDCEEVVIGRYVRNYWVQGNYSLVTIDSNVDERFWKWQPLPTPPKESK